MRKVVCSLVILINSVYLFVTVETGWRSNYDGMGGEIDVENVLPEISPPQLWNVLTG